MFTPPWSAPMKLWEAPMKGRSCWRTRCIVVSVGMSKGRRSAEPGPRPELVAEELPQAVQHALRGSGPRRNVEDASRPELDQEDAGRLRRGLHVVPADVDPGR